jgi:hypothetical protein
LFLLAFFQNTRQATRISLQKSKEPLILEIFDEAVLDIVDE